MPHYAALDVSQETTCVCLVDETGRVIGEAKLPTCPDAIAAWLGKKATNLARVGLETGPMAVWLWNELHARGLPVICLDARYVHAALKVQPNNTNVLGLLNKSSCKRLFRSERAASDDLACDQRRW